MHCIPKRFARASRAALVGLGLVVTMSAVQIGGAMAADPAAVPLKRYDNPTWQFSLDVPESWHAIAPGPALSPDDVGSPYEVIRFSEAGDRTLMSIYRRPYDPAGGVALAARQAQGVLTKDGYSNFTTGEAMVGSRRVMTLDCEKRHADGGVWRVRSFFVADGPLLYILGFGAPDELTLSGLDNEVARSFTFRPSTHG